MGVVNDTSHTTPLAADQYSLYISREHYIPTRETREDECKGLLSTGVFLEIKTEASIARSTGPVV